MSVKNCSDDRSVLGELREMTASEVSTKGSSGYSDQTDVRNSTEGQKGHSKFSGTSKGKIPVNLVRFGLTNERSGCDFRILPCGLRFCRCRDCALHGAMARVCGSSGDRAS